MEKLIHSVDTHLVNYNLRLKKESQKARRMQKNIDQLNLENTNNTLNKKSQGKDIQIS